MTAATHRHPTARAYWVVALVLAAVTAVEVAVSYMPLLAAIRNVLLVLLGAAKFVTVVAVFMHLRYERRTYTVLFLFGLAGTLAVFAAVMAATRAFG